MFKYIYNKRNKKSLGLWFQGIFLINVQRVVIVKLLTCSKLRNTRTRCGICLKLIIKTPERRHWRCSGVFIVNFANISHLF